MAPRQRPLSPFVTIYRWPITMVTSITHRVTGIGLALGTVLLAWWLIAVASGPEAYRTFTAVAVNPLGQIVLYGFVWALAYHLLNGIRHLAWDVGYGFEKRTAAAASWFVILASLAMTALVFALVYTGHGGFNIP